MMHVYGGNLVVFVGCIVVDSFGGVAAGGVEGDFVFSFCYFAATSLLVYGARMWKNWLTLSDSVSPDLEFILVKATLAKREAEERSPGKPRAPMPRL